MVRRARRKCCCETQSPDMEETRDHIIAAGREILLAAQGALSFCKSYVETSVPKSSQPNLLIFFQKAMSVADELSRGLTGVSTLKRAAGDIAKPFFTAMEREMSSDNRALYDAYEKAKRAKGASSRKRSRKASRKRH